MPAAHARCPTLPFLDTNFVPQTRKPAAADKHSKRLQIGLPEIKSIDMSTNDRTGNSMPSQGQIMYPESEYSYIQYGQSAQENIPTSYPPFNSQQNRDEIEAFIAIGRRLNNNATVDSHPTTDEHQEPEDESQTQIPFHFLVHAPSARDDSTPQAASRPPRPRTPVLQTPPSSRRTQVPPNLSISCEKCKSTTSTRQCFAPDCKRVRCASCVTTLCKKNSSDDLKDDDGNLVYICTKVSLLFIVTETSATTYYFSHCSVLHATGRNAMRRPSPCLVATVCCGPGTAKRVPTTLILR